MIIKKLFINLSIRVFIILIDFWLINNLPEVRANKEFWSVKSYSLMTSHISRCFRQTVLCSELKKYSSLNIVTSFINGILRETEVNKVNISKMKKNYVIKDVNTNTNISFNSSSIAL